MPCSHGCAVVVHHVDGPPGEGFSQLLRVSDGRGAEDELGPTAVKRTQAQQTPQDIGQVRAKHAAVGMNFVNDDIAQVFEQLDPLGMVGQDAGMQHVRIGHHDMPCLADGAAGSTGGISIVGVGLDVHTHGFDQLIQLADLIG